MSSSVHTYGSSKKLSKNTFTRTGYAFKGWATSSTGSVVYENQAQIINLTTYNNGKVHLYACWQKESYTITFNTNGGTSVATGSYPYGSSLPTSAKIGYTFNGWTLQGSATVYTQTPDLGVNGAQITLYASWTVKQYQVTIEKSEHTSNADVWGSKEFNSPLEITWSANRAAGYTYSLVNVVIYEADNIGNQIAVYTTGNSATFTMSEVYYPSIRIVVTHVRTINTYSISYELNGGTVSPENPTEYTVESETFTLNNPENEGYTFAGWTGTGLSSASFNVRITQGSTGNRSYVANFTANANTPYTVKHYLEKLNIASPNTSNSAHWDATDTEVLTGTTATNTSATANSYAGFTAMAFSQKSIAANGSTVISIYYTRNTYTLTLNKGTGISSVSNAGVYDYQQSVKIDAEVMVGYTWNSWTGSLNTTTKNYTLTIGTEDITLTANATINKYTITFVSDSYGYVSTDEVVNVPYGSTLSVNGNEITVNDTTVTANANTNCVFKGWTILSNPLTGEYVVEKSLTISAHFELSKVTVTLLANGGSVNPASKLATISQSYGAAFGSLPIPYYDGFQFMGWYLESSFLTKVTESTIVTIAEDHNLYAKWGATVSLAQEGMETNNTYSYNILKESDGSNIVMEAGVTLSSYVVPLNYKIQVVANGTNSSTKQLILLYVNDVYKATSTEFTGNESLAVYKVTNNISIKLVFKNAYEITLTDENNNKIDEDIVSLVTVDSTSSTVVNNSTFIAEDSVIKLTINTNNLPKHFIGFTYKTTDDQNYKMSFESTNTNNIVKELKDNVYTYTISNLDINNITVVMRDEVNVVSASLSPQIQGLTLTETTTGLIRNIISSKSYPLYSGEWTVVCTSGYTLTVSDLELVANSLGVSTSLLRYVNNTWVLTVTANSY